MRTGGRHDASSHDDRFSGAEILGVAESDLGVLHGKTPVDLQVQAAQRACAAAGVPLSEVDGVLVSASASLTPGSLPPAQFSEAVGIRPRYTECGVAGGAAPVMQVARAAAAISRGECRYALVIYGSSQASQRQRRAAGWATDPLSPLVTFEQPTGYRHPVSVHALLATRYLFEYRLTPRVLAAVAVSQRAWASLNPAALRRAPLTVDEVLESPMVSSPLRRLDCCMRTDGGGAVLLGPAGTAAAVPGIRIRGFAERHDYTSIVRSEPVLVSAASDTGARALADAGVTVRDVDCVQVYDAFTSMCLLLLEDLGFAGRGMAGGLVSDGRTRPGGDLPMNTQGGGLSHCHPGMYGIFLVVEAVRQLQGIAGDRQLDGCGLALCHGVGGGGFGIHATLVLARE